MSEVYYNEWEKFPAQWLRNLGDAGLISKGVVDERSIKDVKGSDLAGIRRAHFFAGIGGWDYALKLAGWPDDAEVWTGSCPCQPFSVAGKRKGNADERHLWPAWFGVIRECRPATIFGEQVANEATKAWIDGVFDDLEAAGYSCGQKVLPACSVGLPQIGSRLFWVAAAAGSRRRGRAEMATTISEKSGRSGEDFLLGPRLGGNGSGSALSVTDVCSPSYGLPGRVGRLRAYGNAIVPQVAAEFIMAYMESVGMEAP